MKLTAYSDILHALEEEGRFRKFPSPPANERFIDLTSNDYMGLGRKSAEYIEEFRDSFGYVPMSASASRLLASNQGIFRKLEGFLEDSYGKPAILFNSGYHANVGLVSCLNIPSTLWLTDKLIHASVIDGIRMAKAQFVRWPHNDTKTLREIIDKNRPLYQRIIIVCESVYSMDGDIAPLEELLQIRDEYPEVMLYVDEAHAVGCFGPRGLGLCMDKSSGNFPDILVGTLGKACASYGAFVIADSILKDYIVNTSRPLIFSTAIPPVCAAWSLFMLEKLAAMDEERKRLHDLSHRFRKSVESITGRNNPSRSAIVPLITGSSEKAVALSKALEHRGIVALPIRRPTVPPGGERIRFSLNACLGDEELTYIEGSLKDLIQDENRIFS